MNDEATRILEKALEVLDERGHHKGNYYDPDSGAVCAFGALNVAVHGEAACHPFSVKGRRGEVLTRLADAAGVTYTHEIPSWNDDPNTTPEDVKLAFKRAIAGESA